jgi:ribosomal protein L15
MNLLTSFADEVAPLTNSNIKPIEGIETLEEDEHNSDWIGEYQRGCDWEIYTTELSPTFEGTTFVSLSEILYQKLGVVLFGLEIEELRKEDNSSSSSSSNRNNVKLLLNPADFIIPSKYDYHILAFVIAKNKAQSDLTFSKLSHNESIFNSGMSFSQLSLLTSAITNRITGNGSGQSENHVHPVDSIMSDDDPLNNPLSSMKSSTKSPKAAAARLGSGKGGGNGPNGGGSKKGDNSHRYRQTAYKERLPWQLLLRKYEQEKSTETIQEEMQKLEDQLLREHYFIRETNNSNELADAYIRTSVMEELPYLEQHIIIIGKALSNLYDLIRPLRARSLGILKPIIILYPTDFPLRVWQRIAIFEAIFIVRGSGLEDADIRRCGIFKAKQVVLLAEAASSSSSNGFSSTSSSHLISASSAAPIISSASSAIGLSALDDADSIFCYQAIRRLNESCHIVVEIVRHNNVGYLDPEAGLNSTEVDYKFTPQFASGCLFATSLLDTLVCQSFYNVKIIEILNRLIGGLEKREIDKTTSRFYKKDTNGSGGTTATAAADSSSKTTTNNNGRRRLRGLVGSSLYQIPLPDSLPSRTYGALYTLLAKRKQIPLGILRGVFSNTKSGPKANIMPYVFTNPPKDTELFSCDKIFILSQSPIKITRVNKDDSKELNLYSGIRTKKKTAEDVLNVMSILKDDIKESNSIQEKIDFYVNDFHDDLRDRFNGIFQQMDMIQYNIQNGIKRSSLNIPGVASRLTEEGGIGAGGGVGGGMVRENRSESMYSLNSSSPQTRSNPSSTRTTRISLLRPSKSQEDGLNAVVKNYRNNSSNGSPIPHRISHRLTTVSPMSTPVAMGRKTFSRARTASDTNSLHNSSGSGQSRKKSHSFHFSNSTASVPPPSSVSPIGNRPRTPSSIHSSPSPIIRRRQPGLTPSPNSSPLRIERKRL